MGFGTVKGQTVSGGESNGVPFSVLSHEASACLVKVSPSPMVTVIDSSGGSVVAGGDDSSVSAEDGANL